MEILLITLIVISATALVLSIIFPEKNDMQEAFDEMVEEDMESFNQPFKIKAVEERWQENIIGDKNEI